MIIMYLFEGRDFTWISLNLAAWTMTIVLPNEVHHLSSSPDKENSSPPFRINKNSSLRRVFDYCRWVMLISPGANWGPCTIVFPSYNARVSFMLLSMKIWWLRLGKLYPHHLGYTSASSKYFPSVPVRLFSIVTFCKKTLPLRRTYRELLGRSVDLKTFSEISLPLILTQPSCL